MFLQPTVQSVSQSRLDVSERAIHVDITPTHDTHANAKIEWCLTGSVHTRNQSERLRSISVYESPTSVNGIIRGLVFHSMNAFQQQPCSRTRRLAVHKLFRPRAERITTARGISTCLESHGSGIA